MLSSSDLKMMNQMDMKEIDPSDLIDIRNVYIDPILSQPERVDRYIAQIKNPYCFLSGDTRVRIRFVGEKPLSQSLIAYFSRLKQK